MKTKSGTAMNEKVVPLDQAMEPMTPSPIVQPLSQSRPRSPTSPRESATSRPAAKQTNRSRISRAPTSCSLMPRRGAPPPFRYLPPGVARAKPALEPGRGKAEPRGVSPGGSRSGDLVAGGPRPQRGPDLPEQHGEHRQGHQEEAGGDEEHGKPDGVEHHDRHSLLPPHLLDGEPRDPAHDQEERDAEGERENAEPGAEGAGEMRRDQVHADVAADPEGIGEPPEDDDHLEEARQLVHEELGLTEEVAHQDVEGDQRRDGERCEPREEGGSLRRPDD